MTKQPRSLFYTEDETIAFSVNSYENPVSALIVPCEVLYIRLHFFTQIRHEVMVASLAFVDITGITVSGQLVIALHKISYYTQ